MLVFSTNEKNRQDSYHRKIRWVEVSKVFEGSRTDVQVRERFMNILNPTLQAKKFSEIEKKEVGRLFQLYGAQWSKIAKQVKKISYK